MRLDRVHALPSPRSQHRVRAYRGDPLTPHFHEPRQHFLHRALELYAQKLGFRVITDSTFDGRQRWIELGIPRAETRLVLFTAPGQEAMIAVFMNVPFMADDVEATAREMEAKGVEFVQKAQKADRGTSAIVRDPGGNQCVLSSP